MRKITWTVNGKQIPWPPKPWPGFPVPIWKSKAKFLKDFVAEHQLLPAKQELKVDGVLVKVIPPWWKYGGPREPHLHIGDEIYMVSKAQWKEAVAGLVKGTDLLLAEAKSMEFEPLMEALAEADLVKRAGL